MKIQLTPEQREWAETIRAGILAAREAVEKAEKRREELQTKLDELDREIFEAKRSVDVTNLAALNELEAKKNQLPLVENELEHVKRTLIPKLQIDVRGSANATWRLMASALADFREQYLAEISEKLLPYCSSPETARKAAAQTDAAESLWKYISQRWPDPTASLQEIETLLRGENPWRFTGATQTAETA